MESGTRATLPIDVMKKIFSNLSFRELMCMRIVCKLWNFILDSSNLYYIVEDPTIWCFGFLVREWRDVTGFYGPLYLDDDGIFSRLYISGAPFEKRSRIHMTIGSLVLLSFPIYEFGARQYILANPFTGGVMRIGSIDVGIDGCVSLFEDIDDDEYVFVALRCFLSSDFAYEIYCSRSHCWSLLSVPTHTVVPKVTPPIGASCCGGRMYWVKEKLNCFSKIEYTIFSLDVVHRKLNFCCIPFSDVVSLCLAVHENNLFCIVSMGEVCVWLLQDAEAISGEEQEMGFERDDENVFEDGFRFVWKYLMDFSRDINEKCPGYMAVRSVGSILLMCKYAQIPYMFYDLDRKNCIPAFRKLCTSERYGCYFPTREDCRDVVLG
ncbi:hypothetical protein KI387_010922, partial [Taxus chinensis]